MKLRYILLGIAISTGVGVFFFLNQTPKCSIVKYQNVDCLEGDDVNPKSILKMLIERDKESLKKAYKEWETKNSILKVNDTWLHKLAGTIHFLAKFSTIIPRFGKKHEPKQGKLSPELRAQLEEKLETYKKLIKPHQDRNGFIMHTHCDATLFSGLLSPFMDVKITAARDSEGFWHRRSAEKPCYPNGSASSFSRDMAIGVLWYMYSNKDLESAEKWYEHLKKHNFVMGLGASSRLIAMPNVEATLAEIIYRLGGKNHLVARKQYKTYPKSLNSYPVHLLTMLGLLESEMLGYSPSYVFEAFKGYAKKYPKNPMYQFAYRLYSDGDMTEAAKLLLNEKWWPADRLPRERDRHSDWVTQRDYGKDWLPSTSRANREHTGGDFIVAASHLLKSLK